MSTAWLALIDQRGQARSPLKAHTPLAVTIPTSLVGIIPHSHVSTRDGVMTEGASVTSGHSVISIVE